MTIEEKTKAYDEALEKARMYHDNAKAVEDYAAVARYENIFPQLRESEKEKLRKLVIYRVRTATEMTEGLRELLLDYLEKQKEIPLMDDNADLYFDVWNQQKQNPTKRQCFEEGIRYAQKLQQEQKPAEWSEEDEQWLESIIREYEERLSVDKDHAAIIQIKIDFLKSLRPSWKPSEEHLSALLAVFNDPDNIGSQTCQLALTDLYEHLKKL